MTFLSEKNRILAHCLRFQYRYIVILLVLLLSLPLLLNAIKHHPLPLGSESYFHLSRLGGGEIGFIPFYWLLALPGAAIIVPPLLGLLSMILFLAIARSVNISRRFTFLFSLLLLFSPPFLAAFTTISTYGYLTSLLLLGFFLLTRGKITQGKDWLALVPFLLASFLDIFSGILVLLLVGWYWYRWRKKYAFLSVLVIIFLLNGLVLQAPLFLGPFHAGEFWRDLIADFGGNGIGFFLIVLAVIGLAVTWKQREFLALYFVLPVVLGSYIINTETILPLTLIITAFATMGLITLFDRPWKRKLLQRFTLLVLILGLLFSWLSYVDRVTSIGPSAADQIALTWIRNHVPDSAVILSDPENGYYLSYFAQRTPLLQFHQPENLLLGQAIFSSSYITALFPLLDQHNITVLYITPTMRARQPADQGFLFLLKNERFKLRYANEGYEVWQYGTIR